MTPDEVHKRLADKRAAGASVTDLAEAEEALRAALAERDEARQNTVAWKNAAELTEAILRRERLAALREAQAYIMRQSQEIYGVFLLEHQETSCWVQDLIDRETEKAANVSSHPAS